MAGPAATPIRSAVLVPIPEAEPLVGDLRRDLDRHAAAGVPAHVTVLYPFLAPERIDDAALRALAEAAATVAAFDVAFHQVRWFGDEVVWLAPEPDGPFRTLTEAVVERFPGLAPYEGAFGDDPVPHLTVGHEAPHAQLTAAADRLRAGLPLRARVRTLAVMTGSDRPNSWVTVAALPLG